jgi:hypothetical protein
MTTYVKFLRDSDFGSEFGYGYVDGYLVDTFGKRLAVIVTKEMKIIMKSIESLDVVSEQEYMDSEENYW